MASFGFAAFEVVGDVKDRLLENPLHFFEAYVSATQSTALTRAA